MCLSLVKVQAQILNAVDAKVRSFSMICSIFTVVIGQRLKEKVPAGLGTSHFCSPSYGYSCTTAFVCTQRWQHLERVSCHMTCDHLDAKWFSFFFFFALRLQDQQPAGGLPVQVQRHELHQVAWTGQRQVRKVASVSRQHPSLSPSVTHMHAAVPVSALVVDPCQHDLVAGS